MTTYVQVGLRDQEASTHVGFWSPLDLRLETGWRRVQETNIRTRLDVIDFSVPLYDTPTALAFLSTRQAVYYT